MTDKPASQFLPLWIAAVPIIVGLVLFVLIFESSQQTKNPDLPSILALLKIVSYTLVAVMTAVLVIFFRHVQVYYSMKILPALVASNRLVSVMFDSVSANASFATECEELINAVSGAETNRSAFSEIADLFDWKRRRLIAEFQNIANGHLEIDDPYKEIVTNEEFMQKLSNKLLRAVSYGDHPYWLSSEGKNFVMAQISAIAHHVRIERIFVLESDEKLGDYAEVFKSQREAGIEVWYVLERELAGIGQSAADFVIYDDVAVRVGHADLDPNVLHPTGKFKRATLVMSKAEVKDWETRYDALKSRSQKV